MPHIKFSLCLVWGENNVSEELMPELAHRHRVKLPTCMHSTEYRVQIQEDNSVDSGASVRVVSLLLNKRSQFSTVPSSPFSSACAGSVVPRVPVRYVRQRIPLFFLFVFFFAGQMIILVQSTGPVSQLVSRVSELLH